MANLISSNVQANEIVKAEDFNNAFDSTIGNVAKMATSILESSHDFVIGGKIEKVSGSWTVSVAPIFGVCKDTEVPFCDTEANQNVSLNPGDTSAGVKHGIIEARGSYETFNNQQRAFNDTDTDVITYQYVDTQKRLKAEFQSSFSDAGTVIAPNKTSGWVKLAEILVPQGAGSIDDCTIYNITSDIAGGENTGWTNDKSATYDVGYISDLNARFRAQHNADGSHKAKAIGASNIKIGVDTDNVNGANMPVGTAISIDGASKGATDSIASLISLCASKITEIFNDYVNKGGVYNFNGEVALSSVFSGTEKALANALKIGAAGDGTAYLKIGDRKVLTITSDGKLQTSGYTATANNDIVTKSVTDAISSNIENLSGGLSSVETTVANMEEYINELLSRFEISDVSIQAVSTANVDLKRAQTIDGIALSAGNYVLLKDQTDKTENGLWEVQTGSWNRISTLNSADTYRYKFFITSNGTANKGRLFYYPGKLPSYTSGTTELYFNEAGISLSKIANKIAIRDSDGKITADLTGNADTATKATQDGSGNTITSTYATKTESMKKITWTGTSTSDDTRANWVALGSGYVYITNANLLNGQPGTYGFVISVVLSGEVHQEWWTQPNGKHYRRSGNGSTTAMPGWTEIVDSGSSLLSAKQDKLTAGSNIMISGSTISAKDTTYTSVDAKDGGTDTGLVTSGEKYLWNSKTSNEGTVTSISAGAGLTTNQTNSDAITGSGTIKASLKDEAKSTLEAAKKGSTTSREYAVGLDKNGNLSVNVPWENTDTNTWTALKGATATTAGTAGYAPAPAKGDTTKYLRSDGTWASIGVSLDGSDATKLGVEGTLPVANGGTGGTSAAAAASNLGACAYCETDAASLEKIATMPSFKLVTGAQFRIYFKNNNTTASAQLNVNSTGAKEIYVNGNAVTAINLTAGWYSAVYDGTYYQLRNTGTLVQPVAGKLGTATVGSATAPVYLNGGTATQGSTYAGGTKVTLNGTEKGASTASFYAPTSAGTSGYVLKSNGSGAPTWASFVSSPIKSATLSGTTLTLTLA